MHRIVAACLTVGLLGFGSTGVTAQCTQALTSPITSTNGTIRELASLDLGLGRDLYVGGSFTQINGQSFAHLARWNGVTWSEVGGGVSGAITSMEALEIAGSTNLYVAWQTGGQLHLRRWDGVQWSSLGVDGGSPGRVDAMCVYDDGSGPALHVGGQFASIGGTAANHVAKWNGTAWSALGSAFLYPVNDMIAFDHGAGARLCIAGGLGPFSSCGAVQTWDGAQWTTLGADCEQAYYSVTSFDDGNGPVLYASGQFSGHGVYGSVEEWDGSAWVRMSDFLGAGSVRTFQSFDFGQGERLYGAGAFGKWMSNGQLSSVIRRNASGLWVAFSNTAPMPGPDTTDMLAHDDGRGPALWFAGPFTTFGGAPSFGLEAVRGCIDAQPVHYCTSGTSVALCAPTLVSAGEPSLSGAGGNFVVSATMVDGQRSGGFFYGIQGPHNAPWGDGFLCVKAPVQRAGIGFSDGFSAQCDGALSLDVSQFAATHPGSLGQPFAAGSIVWLQAWVRDPANTSGKTTVHSDGLRFTWIP